MMKFTKADMITIIRLIFLPIVVILILLDYRYIGGAVYFLAALTDALDGYIARKYKQVTKYGGFLDALIDRIFLIVIFVTLVLIGTFKLWIIFAFILVIVLEIVMGWYISKKIKKSYLYYVHRNSIRIFAVLIYLCFGLYIIKFIYADYIFIMALISASYVFIDYIIYIKREL